MKKIMAAIILGFLLFFVLLATLFGPKLINNWKNYQAKKKLIPLTKDFVTAWGTYDYNTYPKEYYEKLKPFVTDSYFKEFSQSKEFQDKRSVNLKKSEYSFREIPGEIKDFEAKKDSYVVTLYVKKYTSSRKEKDKEETARVVVEWVRVNKDFKVTDAKIYSDQK